MIILGESNGGQARPHLRECAARAWIERCRFPWNGPNDFKSDIDPKNLPGSLLNS